MNYEHAEYSHDFTVQLNSMENASLVGRLIYAIWEVEELKLRARERAGRSKVRRGLLFRLSELGRVSVSRLFQR